MKKILKHIFLLSLLAGMIGFGLAASNNKVEKAEADEVTIYSRNGESGNLIFINGGGTYFKDGEADVAIYCQGSSMSAWSDRVSYRMYGDYLRVMIPYYNGNRVTWSKFTVCRYNPSMNPSESGFSGVYNQTNDINFSDLMYAQNVVNITGYVEGRMNYAFSTTQYYGVKAENHMYLDLSNFTSWEEENAKFGLYFAYPQSTNESRWSQQYSTGGYYSSFCWKVNGQDNNHLYECVVPNIYGGDSRNIWNLVIAVRFSSSATEPNWDNKWNQTQDLKFNQSVSNANMIVINDWNSGYLDVDNSIAKDTRLEFYGKYFNDTVACSGHGNSDSTTSEMWNAVKYEYEHHLSRFFEGDVWTTTANPDGNMIEKAMARYDYIVLYKQYAHEDFMNRQESPNKTVYSSIYNFAYNPTNNPTLIIIIIAISILSIGGLITMTQLKRNRNR